MHKTLSPEAIAEEHAIQVKRAGRSRMRGVMAFSLT